MSSMSSPSTGINLSNVSGSFTVTSVDIDDPAGAGIALFDNVASVTFTSGDVTGAGGVAVDVNDASAPVTYGGTIHNSMNLSVQVLDRAGGTVAFNGNIVDTGGGILLDGNSGSINFTGGLDLDTEANDAFTALDGGTVNVTGTNTINTTTGTAVIFASATIGASGVTFQSVSVDGAANGIFLEDTGASGGFEVTGTGTTDGSGGTITRTTGDGIFLDTATNITLRNMTIGDGSATSDQPPDDSVFIGSDGIEMKDVLPGTGTAGLTLDNVKIARTGDHGIRGMGGNVGFRLLNSEIFNAGDDIEEDAMSFGSGANMLTGTVEITNSIIAGMAENGFHVVNMGNDTLDMTVSTSSFMNNDGPVGGCAPSCDGNAIRVIADGSSGTPTINLTVDNTAFTRIAGASIDAVPRRAAWWI